MKTKIQNIKKSALGLAAFAVLASPLAVAAATTDTVINATVGSAITVSSTTPIAINLTPTANPVTTTASDTVTVNTNNTDGYTLTLEDQDAVTNLVSGSNTIAAHTGTHAAPTALATNTWGYAVTGGAFDASYAVQNNSDSYAGKFAGVPANGAPATLKSTNSVASNDVTTVWYGVKVDNTKPSGVYTDTVTYTATVK